MMVGKSRKEQISDLDASIMLTIKDRAYLIKTNKDTSHEDHMLKVYWRMLYALKPKPYESIMLPKGVYKTKNPRSNLG